MREDEVPLHAFRNQRNIAVTAAILAIGFSVSLVLNNFIGVRKSLLEAHHEIEALQSTLIVTQESLRDTQKALADTQKALEKETKALAEARSH